MLPYKIIKDSATNGLRFEESCFALEKALQDEAPASCFVEEEDLQQDLQQELKNSARIHWKKHEDNLLKEAVNKYGPCKWSQIANMVPGKTKKQCCDRWRIHVKGIGRNVWERKDDVALEKAVYEMGDNWTLVAKAVTGKTNKQCRERFKNYIDPNLKRSAYTKEEDDFILASANLGHGWTKISSSLSGRTDANIRTRCHQLRRSSKAKETKTIKDKPKACHKKCTDEFITDNFLDEDAIQSFMAKWEQPKPRIINRVHCFKTRFVKEIKYNFNSNSTSATIKPFEKVLADNSFSLHKINKRICGKRDYGKRDCGKRACLFDLFCHESLAP